MLAEDDLKNSIHIVHVNKPQDICTNLLNVDSPYKKCIMDNGADTSVIGKGWLVVAYTQMKANIVGFDKKAAVKKGLPIVSAVTAVDIENKTVLLRIHEAVLNDAAHHSLMSEFQVRECVHKLDSL